jgi:NADH-quinone oxidoreductase subunit E
MITADPMDVPYVEEFRFLPDYLEKVKALIANYPPGRQASAVIGVLDLAQRQEGWLSRTAMDEVAKLLDMAPIRQEVECLGACVNAPVVQINDDFYEDLDEASLQKVLDALKRGETPKPGPQVDRQTSAPEGGPTTLRSE